jgi:hypothetical protein
MSSGTTLLGTLSTLVTVSTASSIVHVGVSGGLSIVSVDGESGGSLGDNHLEFT